jgi:hypothetical protein
VVKIRILPGKTAFQEGFPGLLLGNFDLFPLRDRVNPTTLFLMGRRTKSNVPQSALRWTIERAGAEFGVSSNTLKKASNQGSVAADNDGLYSTQHICEALLGDMHQEKLKTQRELTRKYSLRAPLPMAAC